MYFTLNIIPLLSPSFLLLSLVRITVHLFLPIALHLCLCPFLLPLHFPPRSTFHLTCFIFSSSLPHSSFYFHDFSIQSPGIFFFPFTIRIFQLSHHSTLPRVFSALSCITFSVLLVYIFRPQPLIHTSCPLVFNGWLCVSTFLGFVIT